MSNYKVKTRDFKIYAIYDPKKKSAFLGKSYAKTLGPLYSKHLCGKNKYTKNYYGKVPPLSFPFLSVLERFSATNSDAFKHLVAWCAYFRDKGYTLLVQEGVKEYARNLLPKTSAIYNSISIIPLEELLEEGSCTPSHTFPHSESNRKHAEKESSSQFNLRIYDNDLEEFLDFCFVEGISRKEGFRRLLFLANSSKQAISKSISDNIYEQRTQIEKLKENLQAAKMEMASQKISPKSKARYSILLTRSNNLMQTYSDYFVPPSKEKPMSITRLSHFHSFQNYSYPDDRSGILVFTLEAIIYGRGRTPALFICGIDNNGQAIKLRYYPKNDYLGYSIPNSKHNHQYSKWLVSYHTAADGAVEMIGSLPLTSIPNTPLSNNGSLRERPSLDQMIANAYLGK